jgi:hypothetical protein
MIVSVPIPNLVSGVSQQAPSLRFPSQAMEQVNCLSSLIDGLSKRPPTRHLGTMVNAAGSAGIEKSLFHLINRDGQERYAVMVRGDVDDNRLVVRGLDGTVYPVVYDANTAEYLACANPSQDLQLVTVADYTFVVNRTKTVAMEPGTTPNPEKQAIVVVVSGHAASNYFVDVQAIENGAPIGVPYRLQYTTGGTTEPLTWRTNQISASLANSSVPGFAARARGHVIRIRRSSSGGQPPLPRDFNITVSDSQGGRSLKVVKDVVDDITDLPKFCFTTLPPVKVIPEEDVSELGYYLKFVSPNTAADTAEEAVNGYWEETVAPGIKHKFNLATMPHVLVREPDGSGGIRFRLRRGDWEDRSVGDENSSPEPGIVGTQIMDLFFFKGRLGLLGRYDKVTMSEAGQYWNLWRTTCTSVVDSDPIDVTVAHNRVSEVRAAIPYNDRLILFAELTQFSLGSSGQILSPTTVQITQTTEFESALTARPVPTGRSIFFAQARGDFSGIREYYQQDAVSETFDAADTTANVSSYIRGNVMDLAVSTNATCAVVVTDEPPHTPAPSGFGFSGPLEDAGGTLYVYKWFINGNEKIQSSWSRWVLPGSSRVIGAGWIDTDLYLAVQRGGTVHLETMRIQDNTRDPGLDFTVHLDGRIDWPPSSRVYIPATDETEMLPPYPAVPGAFEVVSGGESLAWRVVAGKVRVAGSRLTGPLTGGIPYRMLYTFGTPFMRVENRPLLTGRLGLTYGKVSYSQTAAFRVVVNPRHRASYEYRWDGRSVSTLPPLNQGPVLLDGSFRFPVHSRNEEVRISVVNDSHLPTRLVSAEFEGNYVSRGRPM